MTTFVNINVSLSEKSIIKKREVSYVKTEKKNQVLIIIQEVTACKYITIFKIVYHPYVKFHMFKTVSKPRILSDFF